MNKVAIFDIDETLTNWRADKHDAMLRAVDAWNNTQDVAVWDEWNMHCTMDTPNMPMIMLAQQLHAEGYTIALLSARGEANWATTIAFMRTHGVPYSMMILRPLAYEGTTSAVYKAAMVDEHIGWDNVALAVDDSKAVLAMFQDKGIRTIDALA